MTITLHWWVWPLAFFLAGVVGAALLGRRAMRDYDMVTPLLAAGTFLLGLVAAVATVIGHFA